VIGRLLLVEGVVLINNVGRRELREMRVFRLIGWRHQLRGIVMYLSHKLYRPQSEVLLTPCSAKARRYEKK
jgi:hypothetical protein